MMMDNMQLDEENTPHIRRQLVFQGLSVKQKETQFTVDRSVVDVANAPSIPSATKASTKPRRALGDISNNKGGAQFRDFDTPHQKRQAKESNTKDSMASLASHFPLLMTKPRSEEDIEVAYGGLSTKEDNEMHMHELRAQMDAEILSWQQEVDAALAADEDGHDVEDVHIDLPPIHLDHEDAPSFDVLVENDALEIPPIFDDTKLDFEVNE